MSVLLSRVASLNTIPVEESPFCFRATLVGQESDIEIIIGDLL